MIDEDGYNCVFYWFGYAGKVLFRQVTRIPPEAAAWKKHWKPAHNSGKAEFHQTGVPG